MLPKLQSVYAHPEGDAVANRELAITAATVTLARWLGEYLDSINGTEREENISRIDWIMNGVVEYIRDILPENEGITINAVFDTEENFDLVLTLSPEVSTILKVDIRTYK